MLEVSSALELPRLGWKIAATHELIQRKLRLNAPVFGMTFGSAARFSDTPLLFDYSTLMDPIVECEFIFEFKSPVSGVSEITNLEQITEAISNVFIGVELGECRIKDAKEASPLLLMADGFGSGTYIIGSPIPDWKDRFATGIGVELTQNGIAVRHGSSKDVMGSPLRAVSWLANRLKLHGASIQTGDLVSSGSCTGMVKAKRNSVYSCRFLDVGQIDFEIQ
jgi:2-keto-4-pentenoate hydratase